MAAFPEITVVLATHNPREQTFRRVLEGLRAQTLEHTRWEALVVDNCSNPPVEAAWGQRHLPGLTVLRESKLGSGYARLAGIKAARGGLLVFIDDDNIVAPDYLSQALSFMAAHPEVGVLGGRVVGEFALLPPAWAKPHLGLLALRDFGQTTLISPLSGQGTRAYAYFAPFGAGMVIRADIARDHAGQVAAASNFLPGRQGNKLGGCEDCELVQQALAKDYACAYLPALELTHVIPATRLEFRYLQRLAREGQQSWAEFRCRHGLETAIPRWTLPFRWIKGFLTRQAWTRAGYIAWRGYCGYQAGRVTIPAGTPRPPV